MHVKTACKHVGEIDIIYTLLTVKTAFFLLGYSAVVQLKAFCPPPLFIPK